MTVTLERLRWWDIDQLVDLEKILFPDDSPWTEYTFWSELAAGHHYVVHRDPDGGRIIGYAGLAHPEGADAEVQNIAVAPAAQGKGIGRAMLQDLIDHAAPADRILLEVRTDNTPAINLYESMGFRTLGVRRRYYQPSGADAYTMEKLL